MRSEVFPVLARRGLNSGGVSHGAERLLATVVERNKQFFLPRTKTDCSKERRRFPDVLMKEF